jgi:hypothetical protein
MMNDRLHGGRCGCGWSASDAVGNVKVEEGDLEHGIGRREKVVVDRQEREDSGPRFCDDV